MKRRLIICLFVVFMMLSFSVTVVASIIIPEATSKFYVNNFADIFTDSEEKELLDAEKQSQQAANVIRTVNSTITPVAKKVYTVSAL